MLTLICHLARWSLKTEPLNLEELPELKAKVASFLEGSLEVLDGESEEDATQSHGCVEVCQLGKVEGGEV